MKRLAKWTAIIVIIAFALFVGYGLLMDCWDIPGYNPYCGPDLFEDAY